MEEKSRQTDPNNETKKLNRRHDQTHAWQSHGSETSVKNT